MNKISEVEERLEDFIKRALEEDIGNGDHTSLACVEGSAIGAGQLLVKDQGVISGIEMAKAVFNQVDSSLEYSVEMKDGDEVEAGQVAFKVFGKTRSILTSERLVLNLMQRMSGISTTTNQYVRRIAHTNARVLDTRKTTPGLRWFEKEAVKIGGGLNHRFGLFDMILIKDNHVDAAGSIVSALDRVHDYLTFQNLDLKVELEVRSLDELHSALDHGGLDRVMLDNFSVAQTREAVDIIQGQFEIESSGGITLKTINGYAETGVDYISVGALTHSVKSLDLSLKIEPI